MSFAPAIIPVPSYLLEDEELLAMHNKLQEMDSEAEQPDARAAECIAAIRIELTKRGKPISLNDLNI